jgi:helix-turn-helix protein
LKEQSQDSLNARGGRITDLDTHPEPYVTLQAFAAYLRVQERTVMKWIQAGVLIAYQFPTAKVGGEIRIRGQIRIRTSDAALFVERSRLRESP